MNQYLKLVLERVILIACSLKYKALRNWVPLLVEQVSSQMSVLEGHAKTVSSLKGLLSASDLRGTFEEGECQPLKLAALQFEGPISVARQIERNVRVQKSCLLRELQREIMASSGMLETNASLIQQLRNHFQTRSDSRVLSRQSRSLSRHSSASPKPPAGLPFKCSVVRT